MVLTQESSELRYLLRLLKALRRAMRGVDCRILRMMQVVLRNEQL